MEQKIRPSKIWFIIPILIFCFIVVAAISSGVVIYHEITEPKTYVTMPDEQIIEIYSEGDYGIYYEYTTSYELDEDIDFYFENTETGQVFENHSVSYESSYSMVNTGAELISEVTLPEAGEYLVTSSYTNEEVALKFQIGENVVSTPLLALFAGVFVVVFGIWGIIISIVVIVIMRSSSKVKLRKKLEQEQMLKEQNLNNL